MASRETEREARRAQRLEGERRAGRRAARARRLRVLLGALAVAAVAVVVAVLSLGGSDPGGGGGRVSGASDSRALLTAVPQDGAVLGDPDAPVRLVEYADLQCPACRAYAEQALPGLVADYVRPGRVAIEFRHFPILGPDSVTAARAASAAGAQDRLWSFVDLFYRNQGAEGSGYVTPDFLRDLAGGVPGLDPERVIDGLEDPRTAEAVARGTARAEAAGLQGTPSFAVRVGAGAERPVALEGGPAALRAALDRALRSAT